MRHRKFIGALTVTLLAVSCGVAQDGLKSGPQVDETIPGPFHPLNINGPRAGMKFCQV